MLSPNLYLPLGNSLIRRIQSILYLSLSKRDTLQRVPSASRERPTAYATEVGTMGCLNKKLTSTKSVFIDIIDPNPSVITVKILVPPVENTFVTSSSTYIMATESTPFILTKSDVSSYDILIPN